MSSIVATTDLTKRYGSTTVVDRLDLAVPEGSVYGFLGPNGSGKSTTMKMLLSLAQPTSGEVQLLGHPMNRATRRGLLAHVGSLIEAPPGYGHLTGRENLRLAQRLLGLSERQVDQAVRTVRLQDHLDKKVRNYSLGMKQRLGIALALAREPRLLILDEPTNGLDPAGIEEIRELMRRLASQGITIMVSSHLLGEIDKTATFLGILSQGRLIFQGSRADLFQAAPPDVVLRCSDPPAAHRLLAARVPSTLTGQELHLAGLGDQDVAACVDTLVSHRIGVFDVRRREQSLEDVFRDLTAGGRL